MTTRGARWAMAKGVQAPTDSAPAPARPNSRAKPRLEIIAPPCPDATAGSMPIRRTRIVAAASFGQQSVEVHRRDPAAAQSPAPPVFAPPQRKKCLGELAFASMAEDCRPAKARPSAADRNPQAPAVWIAPAVQGILAPVFGCPRVGPWQRRRRTYLLAVDAGVQCRRMRLRDGPGARLGLEMKDAHTPLLLDRRAFATGVAALALTTASATRLSAQAAEPAWQQTLKSLVGDAKPVEGKVTLELPEIAENGNTVPLTVSVESPMTATDYVKAIHILATENPQPGVAT